MEERLLEWLNSLDSIFGSIHNSYVGNRQAILTEGDLHCLCFAHLRNKFEEQNNVGHYKHQLFQLKSRVSVHSEITWFRINQLSGFEVDITVWDDQFLKFDKFDTFEAYPHKGFAYDGPILGIEVKFIREYDNPVKQAITDYEKFIEKLIPAKLQNINDGLYKVCRPDLVKFVSVIGCKRTDHFNKAKEAIGRVLTEKPNKSPIAIKIYLFGPDEIISDETAFIRYYEESLTKKKGSVKP